MTWLDLSRLVLKILLTAWCALPFPLQFHLSIYRWRINRLSHQPHEIPNLATSFCLSFGSVFQFWGSIIGCLFFVYGSICIGHNQNQNGYSMIFAVMFSPSALECWEIFDAQFCLFAILLTSSLLFSLHQILKHWKNFFFLNFLRNDCVMLH